MDALGPTDLFTYVIELNWLEFISKSYIQGIRNSGAQITGIDRVFKTYAAICSKVGSPTKANM